MFASMRWKIPLGLALAGLSTLAQPARAEFLMGHDLRFSHDYPAVGSFFFSPVQFTVTPGVDVAVIVGGTLEYEVDVSDTNILISFRRSAGWGPASFNGPRLEDFSDTVAAFGDVSINSATNLPGFSTSRVFVSENELRVDLQGLNFDRTHVISLDVRPAGVVPEPSSLALAALGALAIPITRRLRDRSTRNARAG